MTTATVAKTDISAEVTNFLIENWERGELLWVDADIAFDPADIARLRGHGQRVVAGVYPKKGKRELAVSFLPDTREVVLGAGGGLLEVRYVGLGFCLTRRRVYEAIERSGTTGCRSVTPGSAGRWSRTSPPWQRTAGVGGGSWPRTSRSATGRGRPGC